MDFVHLHTHSHYSLLDGLPKIDELVTKAKSLGLKALALTDHGTMYGVIEFYQKAQAAGIKPIIGSEVYLARGSRFEKNPQLNEKPYHLILLAKNKKGYLNLIKLTTLAYLEGFYYKPRIDWEILEKYHEGLIALTSCLQGEIPTLIKIGQEEKAAEKIKKYQAIFGPENFFLELQYHPTLPLLEEVNKKLIALSKKTGAPLIATNDVHYLNKEDAEPHDVLICLQTKKKRNDTQRISYLGEDYSFRSPQEMAENFKDVPEAITNTVKIANECQLELEFGKIILPHFEVPGGKTPDEYLKEICYQGIAKRYGQRYGRKGFWKKLAQRLEYELSVIKKTGFASYFLIVQDFVNWAKNNEIVVGPGRGSAAGSLVAYLTNITNIDPLKYELIFERFLNPDRVTMPDFDIDFTDTRRDEVIRYVEKKYGKGHVAQIITFGTMAARAAVRDVGRVLGLSYTYCDHVAKLIPMFMKLPQALTTVDELKEIYEGDPEGKKLLDLALHLEGVARHASTHACGVVVTKEPLENYLPVQYSTQNDRTIISQYSLHPIEDLGLLKVDFLGLKNLTILETAIKIIEKTREVKIQIDKIPLDDKKTFQLLQQAKTTGVFQLESSGMRRYLSQLKPTVLEDIIAMVALYRPGPMEFIPDFIAGKHGLKKTKYLHPLLKPILEKTYGVAVYQEQVMKIAQVIAGFSLSEADVLRKAVGKKIAHLLSEQRDKFIKGCLENNIKKEIAERIFNFIEPFARYGFNRAHAACYALIAYQTAYLKANYPEEFMASLMTADQGDIERTAINVQETENMGIEVLPPEINESFATFTVIKDSIGTANPRIRFGLWAIKNIGENIVKAIIDERKAHGPYKNLEDFLRRVRSKDLNKKSLESLIKCGAMDHLGERGQMINNLDKLLNYSRQIEKETRNGQTNLFRMLPIENTPLLKLNNTNSISRDQRLIWEKELLGLYVSEHPFEEFQKDLEGTVVLIKQIGQNQPTERVRIGGVINKIQKVFTRNQEPMLFVKVEDTTAEIEVLVFPTVLKKSIELWQEGKLVIIEGKVSDKEGLVKILCNEVQEITAELRQNFIKERNLKIKVSSKTIYLKIPAKAQRGLYDRLKEILARHPGDYKVHLRLIKGLKQKTIETNFSIDYNENIIKEINQIIGDKSVELVN